MGAGLDFGSDGQECGRNPVLCRALMPTFHSGWVALEDYQ